MGRETAARQGTERRSLAASHLPLYQNESRRVGGVGGYTHWRQDLRDHVAVRGKDVDSLPRRRPEIPLRVAPDAISHPIPFTDLPGRHDQPATDG